MEIKKWIVTLSEANTSCVSCYGRGNIESPCDDCQFVFTHTYNETEKPNTTFQNIITSFDTYSEADKYMSTWMEIRDFQN